MNKFDVGLSQATRMLGICAVLTAAAWSTGFAATSRHSSSSEPPQVHPTSKPKAAQDQATKALPPPKPAPRGQELERWRDGIPRISPTRIVLSVSKPRMCRDAGIYPNAIGLLR